MISIIIPVYNACKLLDKCVSSVVNQTYNDIEIILVDDGSCDGSSELCDSWAFKDNRIKVIHKKNAGVSSARNEGLKIANGEYILLLDSDDALELNTCEELLRLQKDKNVDCIIFGFKQENGNIWAPRKFKQYDSIGDFRSDFSYWLNTELLSSSVNKLYKRKKIKVLYPEDMSFGEDLIFSLNYLKHCERIFFTPATYYLHNNLNSSSITHTFEPNRIFSIELWQKCIIDFASINNPELYHKYIKDVLFYIKRLYGCKSITYTNKKMILNSWIKKSYLYRISPLYLDNKLDNILLFCIKKSLWFLPWLFLLLKRSMSKILIKK